jgi:hypothetical protein
LSLTQLMQLTYFEVDYYDDRSILITMRTSIKSISGPAISVLMFLMLVNCLSCLRTGILHDIRPAERADVETTKYGTALIRSIYCDISVEPVDEALWLSIRSSDAYGRTPQQGILLRNPPLVAFQIIMKNTLNAPIQLKKARICFGSVAVDAMNVAGIAERLNSPSYSGFNFSEMLSLRRLISEWDYMKNIVYDRDTIGLKLNYVPPRDTVLTMIAFERIPVEVRKFKLQIMIAAMGNIKTVDFDFNRHEYRTGEKDDSKKNRKESAADDE